MAEEPDRIDGLIDAALKRQETGDELGSNLSKESATAPEANTDRINRLIDSAQSRKLGQQQTQQIVNRFGPTPSRLAENRVAELEAQRPALQQYIQQRDAAKSQQQAAQRDFEAISQQDPDAVRDWRNIAKLTIEMDRAGREGDEQAQQLRNALLNQYGDKYLRDALAAELNDKELAERWIKDAPEPDKKWYQQALEFAQPGLDFLDQWGQGALGAVAGVEAALDTDDEVGVGRGLLHAGRGLLKAFDPTNVLPGTGGATGVVGGYDPSVIDMGDYGLSLDRDESGNLNLREAVGLDPDSGGKLGLIADLVGSIALDPTTYVTLGAPRLAKLGMATVEELGPQVMRAAGKEVFDGATVNKALFQSLNKQIVDKGGLRNLDESAQAFYREALDLSIKETVKMGTRRPTTRLLGKAAEDVTMEAVERGGAGGLRFMGQTVPGTGALPRALRSGGILEDSEFERIGRNYETDLDVIQDQLADLEQSMSKLGKGKKAKAARKSLQEEWNFWAGELTDLNKVDPDAAGDLAAEFIIRTHKPGAAGRLIQRDGVLTKMLASLSPRAKLRAAGGKQLADEAGRFYSQARDPEGALDFLIQSGADLKRGGLYRRSLKAFDNNAEEMSRTIMRALTTPAERETIQASVDPATSQLIEVLHQQRYKLRDLELQAGAMPEDLFFPQAELDELAAQGIDVSEYVPLESWVPRIMSQSTLKDIKLLQRMDNTKEFAGKLGLRVTDEAGDAVLRTAGDVDRQIVPGVQDINKVNDAMVQAMENAGVGSKADFFEANPVAAFQAATRTTFEKATSRKLLDDITTLDFEGMPMAFVGVPDGPASKLSRSGDEVVKRAMERAGANSADFRKVSLSDGTVYRVHELIADDLEDMRRIFGDPDAKEQFIAGVNWLNNMWAASATVSGLNTGFVIRNAIGNFFNMFIKGVQSPVAYIRGGRAMNSYHRVVKYMKENGVVWDEAADAVGLTDEYRKVLDLARAEGILNDGRSLDLFSERGVSEAFKQQAQVGTMGALGVPSTRWKPWSPDFGGNLPAAKAGMIVENHARLTMFMDELEKGATPAMAGRRVKETLFDYGDLTRFETRKVRMAARFYTFTRKNFALQASVLMTEPARIANAQQAIDAALEVFSSDPVTGEGDFLPAWMPGAVRGRIGDTNVALDVDTPWKSFSEVVQIALRPPPEDLASQLEADNYFIGSIEQSLNLFSGFPTASMEFLMELQSGRDSFTNRSFRDSDDMRDNMGFRAAATLLPALSRWETALARFGVTREGDAEVEASLAFLASFGGVQAYAMRAQEDASTRWVLEESITEVLDDIAKRQGRDRVTIDEMRELGELSLKDNVTEALLFGYKTVDGRPVWDEEYYDNRLLSLIPADVREAFGLVDPTTQVSADKGGRPDAEPGSEEWLKQVTHDTEQVIRAIEAWRGQPLSQDQKNLVAQLMPGGLSPTDLEERYGFNPYRRNSLEPRSREQEAEAARARAELFEARLAAVGGSLDQIRADHPRISKIERYFLDARALGWDDERIANQMFLSEDEGGLGLYSRNDRAYLNQFLGYDRADGPIPLSTVQIPEFTNKDAAKLQTKVWNQVSELDIVEQLLGYQFTEGQRAAYGYSVLTRAEQRALGIDDLYGGGKLYRNAPSRKDIRTDEQKALDTIAKGETVQRGLTEGPYEGTVRWFDEEG